MPGPVAVPFVENTRLLVGTGMAGATGNVYAGLHEFQDMAFVLHALRPSSFFLDGGANVGVYTVVAGGGVEAQSVAVEPAPEAFRCLLDNVRLNELENRVQVQNAALGEEQGILRMTKSHDAENRVLHAAEGGMEVPQKTVDELIPDDAEEVVLKIDVEGYEAAVLRGASETLSIDRPTALLVELDGAGTCYGFDERKVRDGLRERGFVPAEYDPFQRRLQRRNEYPHQGNTLYVNNLGFFSERVRESASYSILGRQI